MIEFTKTGILRGFPPLILITISDLSCFIWLDMKETLNANFVPAYILPFIGKI